MVKQFGSQVGRRIRGIAGRGSHDTERKFLVKCTRWVGEGMIHSRQWWRGNVGSVWVVLFVHAPQLNKSIFSKRVYGNSCKQNVLSHHKFTGLDGHVMIIRVACYSRESGIRISHSVPERSLSFEKSVKIKNILDEKINLRRED